MPCVEWDAKCGLSPTEWVAAQNLDRRHLSPDAYVTATAAINRILRREAKERQKAGQFDKVKASKAAKARHAVTTKPTEPQKRDCKAEDARSPPAVNSLVPLSASRNHGSGFLLGNRGRGWRGLPHPANKPPALALRVGGGIAFPLPVASSSADTPIVQSHLTDNKVRCTMVARLTREAGYGQRVEANPEG